MPHRHIAMQAQRKARIGVEYGAILHIDVVTKFDDLVVGADNGAEPDRHVVANGDAADHACCRCDKMIGGGEDRYAFTQGED